MVNARAPVIESSATAAIGAIGLPSDWSVVELGELFDIQQGKALAPKHRAGKSPRPFLRTVNVLWGSLNLSHLDQMDFRDDEAARFALKRGDLLVCEGGEVGRTAIWRDEVEGCLYQNHVHRLRTTRADVVPEFYMYWMQAAVLFLGIYGGAENRTTIPNLSKGRLSRFLVPLPPPTEQRAIAAVLGAIRDASAATDKVVAATRELRRSLMRHLFTYGPVQLGQAESVVLKETEVGWIPAHWVVKTLREIVSDGGGSLQTGPFGSLLHASSYVANGIPFIMPKDLTPAGSISLDTAAQVSSEDQSRLSRYSTQLGDLLVARRGDLGRCGLVTEREAGAVCGTGCLRIRPGARLNSSYLMYAIGSTVVKAWLEANAIGTTMANLSTAILASLPLPLPPLDEQARIADLLVGVDRKSAGEENYRDSLKHVFGSLLSNLMTGRRRLALQEVA